jgi:rare lipoprotein A
VSFVLEFPARGARASRFRGALFTLLFALVLLSGCSRRKPAPPAPFTPPPGWTETGVASWYGDPYHGRKAANGEVYDMEQLTAAHRILPFGAIVDVTNISNRKQVRVRITDRGPFVGDRIIDLSRAAARSIDMIGPGTSRVLIRLVEYGPARLLPSGGPFAVQVGAFSERANADELAQRLSRRYDPVGVVRREGSRAPWRVLVGRKSDQAQAEALAGALRHDFNDVLIVRLD